ncbi:hypothetical protein PHISCL_02740 [Aspergillus sclerotialis]|uniref:Uncharacterized protein n=1 Tax=Aspergillus sclerotialis TaxID=2070753 RepID=A0A3A2ZNY1_9EURO|nr:hypothetical protein PHISCL_02740 [Aspergillus sclerotialis]
MYYLARRTFREHITHKSDQGPDPLSNTAHTVTTTIHSMTRRKNDLQITLAYRSIGRKDFATIEIPSTEFCIMTCVLGVFQYPSYFHDISYLLFWHWDKSDSNFHEGVMHKKSIYATATLNSLAVSLAVEVQRDWTHAYSPATYLICKAT